MNLSRVVWRKVEGFAAAGWVTTSTVLAAASQSKSSSEL